MSLSKAFVRSQFPKDSEGLDSAVSAIMDAHGDSIAREKAKYAELEKKFEAQEKAVNEYKATIAELQDESETEKELAEIKAKLTQAEKDHKEALEKAQAEHEATKTTYKTEKANAEMDKAVEQALIESGYSVAALPLFMKAGYERESIKRDKDGKFTNMNEFVETLKTDSTHKEFFGEMQETGADVGNSQNKNKQEADDFLRGFNED